MQIVYLSLYQSIMQYGMVILGDAAKNVLNPLRAQQNNIIRICLKKDNLFGSTFLNNKKFNGFPLELLYKKTKNYYNVCIYINLDFSLANRIISQSGKKDYVIFK